MDHIHLNQPPNHELVVLIAVSCFFLFSVWDTSIPATMRTRQRLSLDQRNQFKIGKFSRLKQRQYSFFCRGKCTFLCFSASSTIWWGWAGMFSMSPGQQRNLCDCSVAILTEMIQWWRWSDSHWRPVQHCWPRNNRSWSHRLLLRCWPIKFLGKGLVAVRHDSNWSRSYLVSLI